MGLVQLSLLLMSFFIAQSVLALDLGTLNCSAQISTVLAKWEVQKPWTRALSTVPGEKVYRVSTLTLGKWVELHIEDQQIKANLFTQNNVLTLTFAKKDCVARATLHEQPAKDRFANQQEYQGYKILRDKDLAALFNQQNAGVLYLWSPHKQISIEGLKQARLAAASMNLELYSVIEPNSTASEVTRVVKELKLAKKDVFYLNSFDLQYRGMRLHFPSLIVFNKGKFTSPVRRGYEDQSIYEEYFKDHM